MSSATSPTLQYPSNYMTQDEFDEVYQFQKKPKDLYKAEHKIETLGIAYAILAGVEPVYGLYTCLFAVLLYMIFGTSKYVSIGSFAVISLMTGISAKNILECITYDFIRSKITDSDESHSHEVDITLHNISRISPYGNVTYTEIVQTLTFFNGVIQLLMGFLRVEFMASYLSDQLVNGFCAG
uniref:SLC26A/SulP transporter domain-containing protein n=1 Tax=Acrobeloides nanus TaxID=290746 RepID=A0A914C1B4_9BILA